MNLISVSRDLLAASAASFLAFSSTAIMPSSISLGSCNLRCASAIAISSFFIAISLCVIATCCSCCACCACFSSTSRWNSSDFCLSSSTPRISILSSNNDKPLVFINCANISLDCIKLIIVLSAISFCIEKLTPVSTFTCKALAS